MVRRSAFALPLMLSVFAVSPLQDSLAASPETVAHPNRWPAAHSPGAISDRQTEDRIAAIVGRMTLEQKVGQMIQADISAITPKDLESYPLGSILAGGNSGPYGDERADAATWRKLVGEYREASRRSGAHIPILFGIDAVHGHSNVPSATIFPHNIGLGAANDPELIQKIGAATAAEVSATGIDWTFAPTLASPQDMRWGRSYEGYSSDPAIVARYAKAMTLGLQGALAPGRPIGPAQVAATAKHYLADGGTRDGKDQGDAQISESELIARHVQGYPTAINAGALTVMASFSSWNGVKNHGNASLLTGVLKERMGFEGLVVGDWNGHGQVPGCTVTDCAATFKAGLDLAMAPDSWKGLFDSTLREARDGSLPMSRINDAVTRILRVKAKLGLLDDKPAERGDLSAFGAPEHLALAREAVAKSLVLLKNNDDLLPIKPGSHVLITGPGADSMAMQTGGWTITWQGVDTTAADFPNGQTIGRGLADAVVKAGGQAAVSKDGAWSTKPDVAIVVYGEQPYAEFQGDIANLAYPSRFGEQDLIRRLKAQGIRVVSVFLSGRPMFVGPLINASDAFVAAWLPGSQGAGVADVLVAGADGKTARNFKGRLPYPWPEDAVSPVQRPLFPLGYGLDYSHHGRLAAVNESPRVKLEPLSSDNEYISKGKALSPWRLGLDSSVTDKAVDLGAQEDARQFSWSGPGAVSIDGPPVNLMRQLDEGFVLSFDWRVDALPSASVLISLGGGKLNLSPMLRLSPIGKASKAQVPLRCFREAGADLKSVGTPLRVSSVKGLGLTVRDVRIEPVGSTIPCPPQN